MAEIKSTLDLVMERTRHLSMSEEEKAGQRKRDFEQRLQGLLQKYSDGASSVDEFREGLRALQNDLGVGDQATVLRALGACIAPGADNARWLLILEWLQPAALEPLKALLAAYSQKRDALLENNRCRQLDDLSARQGISGSAVVPNPGADETYRENLTALKREVQRGIEEVLQQTEYAENLKRSS